MTGPTDLSHGITQSLAMPMNWNVITKEAREAFTKSHDERVPVSRLVPMKNQPRSDFDPEFMGQLKDDIASIGQIYPCIVRPLGNGLFEILDGECRWRVCTELGILCWIKVVEVSDDAAAFLVAVIANMQRKDHTPRELAKMIERMYDRLGATVTQIATTMRLKEGEVYNYLRLRHLNEGVWLYFDKKKPRSERLSMKEAIGVSERPHAKQVEIAQAIIREKGMASTPKPLVQQSPISKPTVVGGSPRQPRTIASASRPVRIPSVTPAKRWDNFAMRAQHVQRMVSELHAEIESLGAAEVAIARTRGNLQHIRDVFSDVANKAQHCSTRVGKN